jgi:hypothetical protein
MQACAEDAGRQAAQQAIDIAALRDGVEASLAAAQGEGGPGPVAEEQLGAQQFWAEFSSQRRRAAREIVVQRQSNNKKSG